jgi:hypothetical protein
MENLSFPTDLKEAADFLYTHLAGCAPLNHSSLDDQGWGCNGYIVKEGY